MTDYLTSRADLVREVKKPGKVLVTMLVRDNVYRIHAEKAALLEFLQREPQENCSVMGWYNCDGIFTIDSNVSQY